MGAEKNGVYLLICDVGLPPCTFVIVRAAFGATLGGADGEGRGAMRGPGIQGVGGLGRGATLPGCLGRGSSSFLGSRELLGWPNHGGNGQSPKLAWLGMARLARLHSASVPPTGTCAGGNGACFLPAAGVESTWRLTARPGGQSTRRMHLLQTGRAQLASVIIAKSEAHRGEECLSTTRSFGVWRRMLCCSIAHVRSGCSLFQTT